MRIVVDTNVFISGVFFAGVPYQILDAWRCGIVQIAVSPQILDEYHRVGKVLAREFPSIEIEPWLGVLTAESIRVDPPTMREQVCRDVDDDKFLALAAAGRADALISGDRDLLVLGSHEGVPVLTPSQFLERFQEQR